MSIFNVKTAGLQGLKRRFDLPSFLIHGLGFIRFFERHYYLKFGSVFLVYYPGSRELTEFSIDTSYPAIKGTLVNLQVVEKPPRLHPLTITGDLNPEVFTNTYMILNA